MISIELPHIIALRVEQTITIKGATAQAQTKPATLETGLVIQVPSYLESGELIQVDTREARFVSRAKSGAARRAQAPPREWTRATGAGRKTMAKDREAIAVDLSSTAEERFISYAHSVITRARCPTCATGSSRSSAASSTRCTRTCG